MKKHIITLIKHPVISGSAIVIIGSNLANVLNFLFNLFMSRNLSPADFGILLSISSIISLATVPAGSIVPTIVNFAATFFAKEDYAGLRGLYSQVNRVSLIIGGILLISFVVFSQAIGGFLKIDNPSVLFLAGAAILVGYLLLTNMAFLQAKLAFFFTSVINFIGSGIKFLGGMAFVFLGYHVAGAVGALLISSLVIYLLSFFDLRKLFSGKVTPVHTPWKEFAVYGVPTFIAVFSLTSFMSMDVILVKHFFSPETAGAYSAIAIVGRIIYFFSAPISGVMFPIIVQKHAKKEPYESEFLISLLLVLLPSLVLTGLYFLFPEFVITSSVKQAQYLTMAKYLGYLGIFYTIFSLLQVFTNFYLSIKKTNIWVPIALIAIAQVGFIWFFHQTIDQIILITVASSGLLLIFYLLYYPYATKR